MRWHALTSSLLSIILLLGTIINARSLHRAKDLTIPILKTQWIDSQQYHTLKSYYLQEYPLFGIFDYSHFFANYLPIGPISFRNNPEVTVDGTVLAHLIDELLEEVNQKKRLRKLKHKKEFTHFTVLRKRNFNRRKKCGFLILKCKDYPFVVKLSIETPESFTQPYKKGFEPTIFFFMAGGINRHLSGFTRIKNAQHIRNYIAKGNLSVKFDIPRKWFYIPQRSKWIKLQGTNIGQHKYIDTEIPGTYCIVADAIEYERKFSLLNKNDRKISMYFCNLIDFYIDPHIDNFMVEKGTNKIIIVDTEHFPSITGLTDVNNIYTSQLHWYSDLTIKCLQDMFLRDKETRKYIQRYGTHHYNL